MENMTLFFVAIRKGNVLPETRCDLDLSIELISHRVNWVALPLRNGTKKRVIFSISVMYSGEETGFSFSKNVWT